MVFAQMIHEIRSKVEVEGSVFTERYYVEQGIKIFGDDAIAGYRKELDQMHQRNAFEPVSVEDLA